MTTSLVLKCPSSSARQCIRVTIELQFIGCELGQSIHILDVSPDVVLLSEPGERQSGSRPALPQPAQFVPADPC